MEHVNQQIAVQISDIKLKKKIRSPVRQPLAHTASCSHTQTTAKLTGTCLPSRMVTKIVYYVRYVSLSASISATPIGRISVKYDTQYF